MANQAFAHRYRETAIQTANPIQLIVILYDAAICSLRQAREHMERKNIEARSRSVNQCISIISELQSSLNLKDGGEIASSLNRLYDFMKSRIFTANVQQKAQSFVEIENLLENLRSAWSELVPQNREEAAPFDAKGLPGPEVIAASNPSAAIPVKSFNVSI